MLPLWCMCHYLCSYMLLVFQTWQWKRLKQLNSPRVAPGACLQCLFIYNIPFVFILILSSACLDLAMTPPGVPAFFSHWSIYLVFLFLTDEHKHSHLMFILSKFYQRTHFLKSFQTAAQFKWDITRLLKFQCSDTIETMLHRRHRSTDVTLILKKTWKWVNFSQAVNWRLVPLVSKQIIEFIYELLPQGVTRTETLNVFISISVTIILRAKWAGQITTSGFLWTTKKGPVLSYTPMNCSRPLLVVTKAWITALSAVAVQVCTSGLRWKTIGSVGCDPYVFIGGSTDCGGCVLMVLLVECTVESYSTSEPLWYGMFVSFWSIIVLTNSAVTQYLFLMSL